MVETIVLYTFQGDGRVQEERGGGMIDTIIAFILGAWFGGCFGLVFAALIRENDDDEEMFTE